VQGLNFVTSFTKAYLTKGLALHQSLKRHCPDCRLFILVFDEDTLQILTDLNLPNVTVISLKELKDPALEAVRPTRTDAEFCWTCKPTTLVYCLSNWELSNISHIDADTFFFSSPEPLYQEVGNADIAIVPHRFPLHLQWRTARSGIYNAGWIYFKNTEIGNRCLSEWRELCLDWCYHRVEATRKCGDQGYLDDWPAQYGAYSVEQKGADLAPWNACGQYNYSVRNGQIYVDGDPLIFYHFHGGFHPGYTIDKFVLGNIYAPYSQALERINANYLHDLQTIQG
jgi:hypothetical protein